MDQLNEIIIKEAEIGDSDRLTEIALLSKRYWQYPERWLDLWREELAVSTHYINDNHVYKALEEQEIVGFYALRIFKDEIIELDHLWVIPSQIGKGVGRALCTHAKNWSLQMGFHTLKVVTDPNAVDFYLRMGGEVISSKDYQIDGITRKLPILLFKIQ